MNSSASGQAGRVRADRGHHEQPHADVEHGALQRRRGGARAGLPGQRAARRRLEPVDSCRQSDHRHSLSVIISDTLDSIDHLYAMISSPKATPF